MNLSLRTSVLFLCLVAPGLAKRISRHDSSAKAAAVELATYMQSLDAEEPHHVCVTGNQAAEAVDSYVLQGTDESRKDLPLTSLISLESCTVQEALVGNTLFTINSDLSDQCAARWKANSLTCDVLFHAHSGADAEQLYKSRLMGDTVDCNAAVIVVHDSPQLPANFNSMMNEHTERFPGQGCTQSPLWIDAKSQTASGDVTKAFKDAFAANAEEIRAQSSLVQGEGTDGTSGFRRKLQ